MSAYERVVGGKLLLKGGVGLVAKKESKKKKKRALEVAAAATVEEARSAQRSAHAPALGQAWRCQP
jgi:hypothetical protein